jgi:hypothetical protein
VTGATAAQVAEKLETRIAALDMAAMERLAQAAYGAAKLAFFFGTGFALAGDAGCFAARFS